jgi:hypothetical protein
MAGILPPSNHGQPCMYNDPSSVYVKTEYDQGKTKQILNVDFNEQD